VCSRNGANILRGRPFSTFALALTVTLGMVAIASAAATRVRWDIVSIDFTRLPLTLRSGGPASALANDGSRITLTGSGTFFPGSVIPPTGGGTWETSSASNVVTGSGTYKVTGLVQWENGAGTNTDIDAISQATRTGGLAVLRVEYSDGSHGILVVSCRLTGTPVTVFEGITATKGVVAYSDRGRPAPGVDANRTLFHIE
jgi:hypothetical protein